MAYISLFSERFGDAIAGGVIGALVALGVMIAVLVALAVYIYFAVAWITIAKKFNYKYPWLAWIPFANLAMIIQLGGFHWAWIFLLLVPFLGWVAFLVIFIIATWRIFEKRKYPGWFSISIIIPQVGAILYLIAIGFVAWKDNVRIISFPHKRKTAKRRR